MSLSGATVAIVGMGLMGGSLGKALVRDGLCKEVRGLVRREEAIQECLDLRAAHSAGIDPTVVLNGADLVVIATPVRTIVEQIKSLSPCLGHGTVVTDLGSVKRGVVRAMQDLPPGVSGVPGHPMCGKETSGIRVADPDLYRDKVWVVIPPEDRDQAAVRLVERMVVDVGARPVRMTGHDHDLAAATVSHLPYTLAVALVTAAEEISAGNPAVWQLASSGFRDTSRVAAGDLTMMTDILAANRDNVMHALGTVRRNLDRILDLLDNGDEPALRDMLAKARIRRSAMFRPESIPPARTLAE